jgi:hypothetical protein
MAMVEREVGKESKNAISALKNSKLSTYERESICLRATALAGPYAKTPCFWQNDAKLAGIQA